MKKPPEAAPKLVIMEANKARLERERDIVFPLWKDAIETAEGNVSKLGRMMFTEWFDKPYVPKKGSKRTAKQVVRDKAHRMLKRLGLVAYARELRVKATGKSMGTPVHGKRGKYNKRKKETT